MTRRDSKIEVFMNIAKEISRLSTCKRLAVGAVLTTKDFHILGEGYNGRASGLPHCCDDNPEADKEKCFCTHAEINAIVSGSYTLKEEKTIFVTAFPCNECLKALSRANVTMIYYADPYRYFESSSKLAKFFGIEFQEVR